MLKNLFYNEKLNQGPKLKEINGNATFVPTSENSCSVTYYTEVQTKIWIPKTIHYLFKDYFATQTLTRFKKYMEKEVNVVATKERILGLTRL